MDQQERLLAHLGAERDCLRELRALLELEAEALRHLRRPGLLAVAEDQARLAERHQALVELRAEVFAPWATPTTLSALREDLPGEPAERVAELQSEMASLAAVIASLREDNHHYASMGRQAIDDVLGVLVKRQGGSSTTYGGDGRVKVGERSHRLWRMG